MITGLLAALSACGSSIEYTARGGELAPEVALELEVDRAPNAQGRWPVTIQLERLPWPSELGAAAYVGWIHEEGAPRPRPLGPLRYDRDARFGEVSGTSAEQRFTVFVTAEQDETPSAPSDRVLVRREVLHDPH